MVEKQKEYLSAESYSIIFKVQEREDNIKSGLSQKIKNLKSP